MIRLRSSLLGAMVVCLVGPALLGQDLLVSSRFTNNVLRYDAVTGAPRGVFAEGNGLANPNGIAYGPDGNLYVGLGDVGEVHKYEGRTGRFLGKFVFDDPATASVDEAGGLPGCRAIAFGPDGNLYVTGGSAATNGRIFRYDGKTGAFLGVFAQGTGNGMSGPVGLTFGPDGNLYVGGALSQAVSVYAGGTGQFLRKFNCPGYTNITGVTFGPDGLLYAATPVENTILRFDSQTGACRGAFASGGGLSTPIGLTFASDGSLVVGSFSTNSVLRFDGRTGQPLGTLVASGAGGLSGTHNFAFVPAPAPAAFVERLVPIVLDFFGVGGVRFTTELSLANRGTTPATLELRYTAATILDAAGSGTVTETLASGQQLVVADAIAYLRQKGLAIPDDGRQGGTLRVRFTGLSSPSAGAATARTTGPSGAGRSGLALPGVRAEEGFTGPARLFGLRENAADRSNLALINLSDSGSVTLRVTVRSGDGSGASVVLPDVTLGPLQWAQVDRVLRQAGYVTGFATVERVAGTGSFYTYAVVNDNATADGSYVSPVSAGAAAEPLVLPVIVETVSFQSELVLANPGSEPLTVSLRYVESLNATGRGGTVTESLGPFEQRIVPEAIDWLRGKGLALGARGSSSAGTLTATFQKAGAAAYGFLGARTSAPGDGGRYGLFYRALAPSEAASDEAWVFGLTQDALSRSNLAVASAGDVGDQTTVRLDVFDGATGRLAGSLAVPALPPGGWTQIGGVLEGLGVSNGYVRMVRLSGRDRLIPYGVVNDGATSTSGATNDGSYVTFTAGDSVVVPPGSVGPAGGTVSAFSGAVSLTVPPGAVDTVVAITFERATAPLDSDLDAESVFTIGPPGIRFARPATLALTYKRENVPAGLADDQLAVQRLDGEVWTETTTGVVDAAKLTASGGISSAGVHGVRRARSRVACTSAESRQFDFWLGSFTFRAPGAFPGTEDVTRDPEGCVLLESFADSSGARGRSTSLYDPRSSLWYQTYVDTFANRLVLVGRLEGSRMVLYQTPILRYGWEPRDATRVRYYGESSTDGGATWKSAFEATYTRR